jgi:hypothetical protein
MLGFGPKTASSLEGDSKMISLSCRATLFVFAMASFGAANAQGSDQTAVYEALFAQVDSMGLGKTYFVREMEVTPPDFLPDSDVRFPAEIAAHAVESFGRVVVSFVDESFLSGLWDSGCRAGWESFHQRYPDAGDLTQVSRVVFNDLRNQAAVYLEQGRGCLGSCGATYHLTNDAGQWAVTDRRTGAWCS